MAKELGGLGFRNTHGFNLAQRGKQDWNLLTNPDTIISKFLKAKYYLRRDFLETKVGYNPSYSRRSICVSQVVVRKDFRWKIGDDSLINIWSEPWIKGECKHLNFLFLKLKI